MLDVDRKCFTHAPHQLEGQISVPFFPWFIIRQKDEIQEGNLGNDKLVSSIVYTSSRGYMYTPTA